MKSNIVKKASILISLLFFLGCLGTAYAQGSPTDASGTPSVTEKTDTAAAPKTPDKKRSLDEAIKQAKASGVIDATAKPGFLGIPGAPNVNPFVAFLWAIWVGWIFSTVGAFGGVMAGVGHISVFGLGDYAASFGKGSPMNKGITDSIRVSNQWLVGCSALISSFKYTRMGRIVLPLGISLGIGSIAGAILIPKLTQGKLNFSSYVGYFGLFVLALGCYLLYETTPGARAKKQKAAAAAKAFEEAEKNHAKGGQAQTRVKFLKFSLTRITFTFCGVEFSFNPIIPIIFGFCVSAIASFLGVGGGFLVVPFLTSVCQLPMYLAAGTSAFAVLVGMATSISTFMFGGTPVYWQLIGLELTGIVLGSWVGPITAKYIPDIWLKRIFIVLAFIVGINFILRGFTPYRLW